MQAIVDAAILTRKMGKRRYLKEVKAFFSVKLLNVNAFQLIPSHQLQTAKNGRNLFAQAQQIAYVMDFNRRKCQNATLMGTLTFSRTTSYRLLFDEKRNGARQNAN